MLICICPVIFITRLRVSFCIKFFKKKNNKKNKTKQNKQDSKILLVSCCFPPSIFQIFLNAPTSISTIPLKSTSLIEES